MEVRIIMDMFGLYSKGDKIEPIGKITGSHSKFYRREILMWIKQNCVTCGRD
jgi:hypothetical protein